MPSLHSATESMLLLKTPRAYHQSSPTSPMMASHRGHDMHRALAVASPSQRHCPWTPSSQPYSSLSTSVRHSYMLSCLPHKPQLTPPSCFEDHEKISPLPAECAVSARRMRSLAVGEGDGEGEGEGDGESDRDDEPLPLALALWGDGEGDDNGDGDGEGNVLGAVSLPSVSPVARFPVARSSLVQTCR